MSERVHLGRPIIAGGHRIESVVVRRPDGRDRAVLGQALAVVANRPRHPDDIARANRIIAAHLSSLGLIALSIEDHTVLVPIVEQVAAYMTRDQN